MTSRVRCGCGRIYDPVKHPICPDCGAESAVESVVVAEKVKPPSPPEIPEQSTTDDQSGRGPSIVEVLKNLPLPVLVGAAVFLIIILFFALRPRHPAENAASNKSDGFGPSQTPSPSQSASVPAQIPAPGIVIPPGMTTTAVDLNQLIASAPAGGTVNVPAGLYPGGLTVTRAVRIVADPRAGGQIFIQSEGKECLSVRAKGVSIQGVQFMCNGIGALPAISVADGGELDLEGCKVQSMSALGVQVTGNASIKALGSTFAATKGSAVRLDKRSQGNFTQSSFSNSVIGLALSDGAKAGLHSCAFEQVGMNDSSGATIAASGEGTEFTGEDCHFSNNSVGVQLSDKASLILSKSEFKDNTTASARGVVSAGAIVLRDSSHATIRNTSLTNSSPYALNVMAGSNLVIEDCDIVGSRTVGLVIGDRNGPGAHADVKDSRFTRNSTGIGVYAGGSAVIENSDCRLNNEGVVVFDPSSQVKLVKTNLISNRDHGLYAYSNADVTAIDSNIQNNARGVQTGTQRKSAQRASVRLENCRFGGNQVFAVGAYVQSQLSMANCTFDGTDKLSVYHERGAIVENDSAPANPEAVSSASPESSPESTATNNSGLSPRPKRKADKHRRADDLSRMIRRWIPGR